MFKGRPHTLVALLVSTLVVASAAGAPVEAQLRGTVRDPAHDPLGGASVTLTNVQTGLRRRCQTDTQGRYVVVAAPGTYRVSADLFGYVGEARDNVTLQARKPLLLDFSLGLAGGEPAKSPNRRNP